MQKEKKEINITMIHLRKIKLEGIDMKMINRTRIGMGINMKEINLQEKIIFVKNREKEKRKEQVNLTHAMTMKKYIIEALRITERIDIMMCILMKKEIIIHENIQD